MDNFNDIINDAIDAIRNRINDLQDQWGILNNQRRNASRRRLPIINQEI